MCEACHNGEWEGVMHVDGKGPLTAAITAAPTLTARITPMLASVCTEFHVFQSL